MANLNTAQIAHDLLGGQSQRIYHQNLKAIVTRFAGNVLENPNPQIDLLEAGDLGFITTDPAGQNPTHSYEQKGLLTSVKRPPEDKEYGHHAAVNLHNTVLPDVFMLTATFIEPKLEPGNTNPPFGRYDAVLLLSNSTTLSIGVGATTRFSSTGQQLHSHGLAPELNRPEINPKFFQQVTDDLNPSTFTLVLRVKRSTGQGHAILFVGDVQADSADFTFQLASGVTLNMATVLDNIRFGVHTSEHGSDYRASVYATEFEIWAPISGDHWMRAVHSHRYAHIEAPSTGHNLLQWDWDADDNQLFKFDRRINVDTGEEYYYIDVALQRRLHDAGLDGDGNRRITLAVAVDGEENQKWKLIPATDPADGSFFIQSKSSGWVMDVKGGLTDKGVTVIQWHLVGFANQRWILIPRTSVPID